MTMIAGTASADTTTGAITGTGMALAIANALYTYYSSTFTSAQLSYQNPLATPPNAYVYVVGAAQAAIGQANAMASGIVGYILANAVIPAGGLLDHGGGTCSGSTTVT